MKKEAKAIEFTQSFVIMGTIEKTETFRSKGGGLNIKIQTGEKDKANDLIIAEGNVCEITFRVSTQKSIEPDDGSQEGLDFDDIDTDGTEA